MIVTYCTKCVSTKCVRIGAQAKLAGADAALDEAIHELADARNEAVRI